MSFSRDPATAHYCGGDSASARDGSPRRSPTSCPAVGSDGACLRDHHAPTDRRFHPHLSSSLLRVEYGPKYREPSALIGAGSPTRRSSRPTSPDRMAAHRAQAQAGALAQLQAQAARYTRDHTNELEADLHESPMRVAPTPTPRGQTAPSASATPATAAKLTDVDALSQQLEFDMHLLAQLKQERENLSRKFDSIMRAIAEEASASTLDGDGLNTTSTDLGESAAVLQHQFGGQLERYDARIAQLENAISDAAKQMAIGHHQAQPEPQQQPSSQQRSQSPRRVSFSPERHRSSSPPSRPLSPRSPSRQPQPQPQSQQPRELLSPLYPSSDSAPFPPLQPLFDSPNFDHTLPPHLHKSFNALKATFATRVSARDIVMREAGDAQFRELQDDLLRQNELASTTMTQQELLIAELRNELTLTQALVADSESRLKGGDTVPAAPGGSFMTGSVDHHQSSMVQSLLHKLSVERGRYEEVYATLLQSKKALEDQTAGNVLQIQSLKAQLADERERHTHDRKTLTQAFSAELEEKDQALKLATSKCEALEKKEKELTTQLTECQQAKNELAAQTSSITQSMNQHRQDGLELGLKIKELEATRETLQERLEAANSRSTNEHLEALTLRGEQLQWEAERDALQARLMDELRNTDGLTRLLEQEMDAVVKAKAEVEEERRSRAEGERGRDAMRREAKEKDHSVRIAQERASQAASQVSELESRLQAAREEAQQQVRQHEMIVAGLRGDLKRLEHEAALAQEASKHAQASTERENAASATLREQLRAAEQKLHELQFEHDTLLSTQATTDGEVSRALRQMKKMAADKAAFYADIDRLQQQLADTEAQLQQSQRARSADVDQLRQAASKEVEQVRQDAARQLEEVDKQLEQERYEAAHLLEHVRHASAKELANLRADATRQLDQLREESLHELETVRVSLKNDLEQAAQNHRIEVSSLQATQETLQEKLRTASRLQESMAQAATSFTSIMQQRQVASPTSSAAASRRRSPLRSPTRRPPVTAAPLSPSQPIRRAPTLAASASRPPPRVVPTVPSSSPQSPARTLSPTSSHFTQSLSASTRNAMTMPDLLSTSMLAASAADPRMVAASAVGAAPSVPAPSPPAVATRAPYASDPAMLQQLAELRQLRESLANDPLLRPPTSVSRRALSPPRTTTSSDDSSHRSVSPPRQLHSSSLIVRSPEQRRSHHAPRPHSPSEFDDDVLVLSSHVIPASVVTTTATPLLQRSPQPQQRTRH